MACVSSGEMNVDRGGGVDQEAGMVWVPKGGNGTCFEDPNNDGGGDSGLEMSYGNANEVDTRIRREFAMLQMLIVLLPSFFSRTVPARFEYHATRPFQSLIVSYTHGLDQAAPCAPHIASTYAKRSSHIDC